MGDKEITSNYQEFRVKWLNYIEKILQGIWNSLRLMRWNELSDFEIMRFYCTVLSNWYTRLEGLHVQVETNTTYTGFRMRVYLLFPKYYTKCLYSEDHVYLNMLLSYLYICSFSNPTCYLFCCKPNSTKITFKHDIEEPLLSSPVMTKVK